MPRKPAKRSSRTPRSSRKHTPAGARAPAALRVPIEVRVPTAGLRSYDLLGVGYVHNEIVPDRRLACPVARGIPLPAGAVHDAEALSLLDAAGQPVPRQVRSLATWPDGSVMFAHVAFQADTANDAPAQLTLLTTGGPPAPGHSPQVTVETQAEQVVVDTGTLRAAISRRGGAPALALALHGRVIMVGQLDLWTTDAAGAMYHGRIDGPRAVRVVEAGPLVAVVELAGRHVNDAGAVFLDFILRLRLDAGRSELRLSHTFLNLGDEPEGVTVGSIGLHLPELHDNPDTAQAPAAAKPPSTTPPKAAPQHIVRQTSAGPESFARFAEFPEDVDITISGAGPRLADTAPLREDTTGYPPYILRYQAHVDHWIGLRGRDWSAVTFIHEARENWPKRLLAKGGVLEYHLWPAAPGSAAAPGTAQSQLQDLRQGMARTHHIELAFLPGDAPPVAMQTHTMQASVPALVVVPFSWYQRCRVLGMEHVMEWLPRRYPLLEGRLASMIERGWLTGMLNYGDDPDAGYGASYAALGITTSTVWINNEHDFMDQAVVQFWRSGRPNAWKSARVCAEHQIDVDFVRKSDDRWKAGAIPAHSALHTTASAYPSHLWTEGLLHYYLTSGDDRALEVASSIGRLICQYVEERYTSLASESRMEGWALIALAALVEVTHDARCLAAARTIVARIRAAVARNGAYDAMGINYGTGTVFTGLSMLHRATGDTEALTLLTDILDWHQQHGRNDLGVVFSDLLGPYDLNLTLPGYAHAYHATGKRKYRDAGLELLDFTGPPEPQGAVRSAGKCYRTFVPFLQVAHEAGVLGKIEERMR